jgi:hypothetical protein
MEWLKAAELAAANLARRLDRVAYCALIVGVCYVAFTLARLHVMGYDPSAFVVFGARFGDPSRVPASLSVYKNAWGFDGQHYSTLSLDPVTAQGEATGIRLDNPPDRQQRILYSLRVWLLSFGHAALVPGIMILVNLAALVLLGWVGGRYDRALGQHALWGLLLAANPGCVVSLAMDLPEALSALCVAAGLYVTSRGRPLVDVGLLALALLARETAVLVVVGIGPVWCAQRLGVLQTATRLR